MSECLVEELLEIAGNETTPKSVRRHISCARAHLSLSHLRIAFLKHFAKNELKLRFEFFFVFDVKRKRSTFFLLMPNVYQLLNVDRAISRILTLRRKYVFLRTGRTMCSKMYKKTENKAGRIQP